MLSCASRGPWLLNAAIQAGWCNRLFECKSRYRPTKPPFKFTSSVGRLGHETVTTQNARDFKAGWAQMFITDPGPGVTGTKSSVNTLKTLYLRTLYY